jgi:hypothetical protein
MAGRLQARDRIVLCTAREASCAPCRRVMPGALGVWHVPLTLVGPS